jgi:hypothetical protein
MIRNKLTDILVLAAAASSAALVSCSVDTRPLAEDGQADDSYGEAGFKLSLPSGAALSSATYVVTGPAGFSKTGTVDLSKSSTVAISLSLPVGGPYTLTLNGTTVDGATKCSGSASFSITAHQSTKVTLPISCKEPARTGSALLNGELNVCPQLDDLSTSPSEVLVGSSLALSASAHDADAAPSALSYTWAASSGTLSSTSAKNPTFSCTVPGPVSISVTVSDGDNSPGCADTQTTTVTCTKATATLALFGDWPYGNIIDTAPGFIAQVNSDPDVELAVHVGDIHSGSQACSDTYNHEIYDYFQQFSDPLVYTPGDNEWTDCQKTKELSSGYPIDELNKLRALFFAAPGHTLGGSPKTVLSQANGFDAAHPEDAAYVENVMWEQARTLFVTLNFPGSNDDHLPWAAPFSNPTAQADEIARRDAANSRWLAKAFATATAHGDAAVMIAWQADMWDAAQVAPGGDGLASYDFIVSQLADLSRAFAKPVLLVNGDSHLYEADRPLADPTAAAYGYHPVSAPVPNLSRITVDGSSNFKDWVKLVVDPSTPNVFSFTRIPTP